MRSRVAMWVAAAEAELASAERVRRRLDWIERTWWLAFGAVFLLGVVVGLVL